MLRMDIDYIYYRILIQVPWSSEIPLPQLEREDRLWVRLLYTLCGP